MMERSNQLQRHRGPDGAGVYQLNNLALGHRRLKIFDLTDRAAQPMVDHELGLALVFNGAIYNFHELRDELKTKGYHFVSDSDTEVLLKAYHAWGEEAIPRLRGMFAFALHERDSGRLVMARDRLGIKPLYYARTSQGFRFASTLPPLLAYPDIDRTLDPAALHYYLRFHAVPEPLTLLRGVRKMLPGSILTVSREGEVKERRYWQLQVAEQNTDRTLSAAEWEEATREALMLAVDRQLQADVPVGILLSGGLDSSLLVAIAALEGKKIKTFSIGFESAHGEMGDEFSYSDAVARHFGTEHYQLFVNNQQLLGSLDACVRAMSEPMISHDNIGFFLLAKEVSKHVKVALSGQGADEIFGGYHWFQTLAGKPAEEDDIAFYSRHVLDRDYAEYCNLLTPEWRTDDLADRFLRESFAANGSPSLVDNALALDASFALANGPLGRVDNMTMAASLEARVPFLDEAVVDLVTRMPLKYKLPEKAILKQLGRKLLPSEVVDRPKGYFPVPALKYLQGPVLALIRDVLSSSRLDGIFDRQAIDHLLAMPDRHLTPLGASKLWQIGLLHYWLQLQEAG